PPSSSAPTTPTTTTNTKTTSQLTNPLLPTPTRPTPLPLTRFSPDELQKRRAAGLCFRCPEKYIPGHKCNPPQFLLIIDNEDSNTTQHSPDPLPFPSDSHDTPTEYLLLNDDNNHTVTTTIPSHFLSLSPAALHGLFSLRTLRVTG
nr:cysteamine dioxygenase [Tanacetum cinerariifolium]